jgi:Uma2 family endonuclease
MGTITFIGDPGPVTVPSWVTDLESFRRWARSDHSPEKGRIGYLKGEVWIDMSKEQLFSHSQVKGEIHRVLANLVKTGKLGLLFPDGILLSNVDADISCQPDVTFVTHEGLQDRVRLLEGADEGFVELEGSPDMVLEVVSRSSVHKDTVQLRQAYHEAGIREYWLVDARSEPLKFDILRYTARGYSATRKKDGWLRSTVFGKEFRLLCQPDERSQPDYTLEMR